MTTLPAAFWRVFDLRMCMTLCANIRDPPMIAKGALYDITYLICMSEPSGSLFLAAYKCHPLVTTSAQTFPYVWVTIHASCFLRLLKRAAGGGADTVCETFVVPEGAVL